MLGKKLVLAIATLALTVVSASAADLAARPYTKAPPMVASIYDWSGFYLGANAGYGSSHDCFNVLSGGAFVSEGCHNATGAVAGAQLGYRWQTGTLVFGVEAQGDWAGLRGSNPSSFLAGATNTSKVNSFGLFTGQVGYAWNNTLLYVKGGAAVTGDKWSGVTAAGTADAASDTHWGAAVGVGLEYGFTPNWSAAFEYDHLFTGKKTDNFTATTAPVGAFTRTDNVSQGVDTVTARINYHFGGPAVGHY